MFIGSGFESRLELQRSAMFWSATLTTGYIPLRWSGDSLSELVFYKHSVPTRRRVRLERLCQKN